MVLRPCGPNLREEHPLCSKTSPNSNLPCPWPRKSMSPGQLQLNTDPNSGYFVEGVAFNRNPYKPISMMNALRFSVINFPKSKRLSEQRMGYRRYRIASREVQFLNASTQIDRPKALQRCSLVDENYPS